MDRLGAQEGAARGHAGSSVSRTSAQSEEAPRGIPGRLAAVRLWPRRLVAGVEIPAVQDAGVPATKQHPAVHWLSRPQARPVACGAPQTVPLHHEPVSRVRVTCGVVARARRLARRVSSVALVEAARAHCPGHAGLPKPSQVPAVVCQRSPGRAHSGRADAAGGVLRAGVPCTAEAVRAASRGSRVRAVAHAAINHPAATRRRACRTWWRRKPRLGERHAARGMFGHGACPLRCNRSLPVHFLLSVRIWRRKSRRNRCRSRCRRASIRRCRSVRAYHGAQWPLLQSAG